ERYLDAGYPPCRIEPPTPPFRKRQPADNAATAGAAAASDDSRPDEVVLTIVVTEGPFLRVDRIEPIAPDASFRDAIAALLAVHVGQPWRRADHAVIAATVREFWQERGFYDASVKVDAKTSEATGSVTLVVTSEPGGKWTIGEVTIDTDSLSEGFVRSIIPLRAGQEQEFSLSREREAYRQLLRTGLVDRVTFERLADPERRTVDYHVHVREVRSVIIRPHIGWGSYEGPRAWLQLAETNMFGAAREISLTGGISLRSSWGELKYTDPWTLGGSFPFSLSLFYRKRDEPDFGRQDFGGRLLFSHSFTPELDASLFYEFRDTQAFDITDPASTSAETARLGSLGLRLRWANAEPLIVPRHGMRHSLQIEHYNQGLGATLDFTKFRLDSAVYLPLDQEQRVVLALGYLMEFFLEHSDTGIGIPIQERVFNGGATSVRCFGEQGLRAWDFPDSTRGGQFRQVVSVELRFPLVWELGLDGAVFVDAGNLAPQLDSAFSHFRVGIGVGLRYMTPIGPARLDVAWNTYPRPGEEQWVFHFWIGFPF
ncbi:MAG: outer membrane protein assembly factor, partial [Planctomycetota bacterium]